MAEVLDESEDEHSPQKQKKTRTKYRDFIDNMLEKYGEEYVKVYKLKEQLRQKHLRQNMSGERLERYREKAKLRQRRYQERQNILKSKRRTRSSAPELEAEQEEKRRYWREKQRLSRLRKQRKHAKEEEERNRSHEEQQEGQQESSVEDNGFETSCAWDEDTSAFDNAPSKRQAVFRVQKGLPVSDRDKWAEVVSTVVNDATPRKKAKLETRGICISKALEESRKIISRIQKLDEECRNKRDKESIFTRRILVDIMGGATSSAAASASASTSVSAAASGSSSTSINVMASESSSSISLTDSECTSANILVPDSESESSLFLGKYS